MDEIIRKIDNFIKRYHTVLLVQNILFFTVYIAILILVFSFLEYWIWFSSFGRKLLLFAGLSFILFSGVYFFLLPFFKISKYYKKIDRKVAADLIGNFFPEISDKFRNSLELNDLIDVSRENHDLLSAAIKQKSYFLANFNFVKAVDYSILKKIVLYFAVISLIFTTLMISSPSVIKGSITRIANFNHDFPKPAPFDFLLKNTSLTAVQGESVDLLLDLVGNRLPANVNIVINDNSIPMTAINKSSFTYNISQLKSSFNFYFQTGEYRSQSYYFTVITKPVIQGFAVELSYPAYLEKPNETIRNISDLTVPFGTTVKWSFVTRMVKSMEVITQENNIQLESSAIKDHVFQYKLNFRNSSSMIFRASNFDQNAYDSLFTSINVIPDLFPSIQVSEITDTLIPSRRYFRGNILDDYGFSSLNFYYKTANEAKFNKLSIPLQKQIIEQEFFFMYDFSEIENWRDATVYYYFEVKDNDGVVGPKPARTLENSFKMPDKSEIKEAYNQKNENLSSGINSSLNKVQQIKKELDQLRFDMLNKKNLNWEDKNKIDQLLQKHNELEKELESIREMNFEKNIFEDFMKDIRPDLLEKQLLLEKMFNDMFSEEMKQMIRDMQQMLNELNKDKIVEQLDKIKLRTEDIEKELDRNLELFKQLEFEKKMDATINDISQLKEKLDSLYKKTQDSKANKNELLEEQNKINQEFSEIQKELEELKSQNEELFNQLQLPDLSKLQKEIESELKQSSDNLSKGRQSQAGKNQKSASEKMEELSSSLAQAMGEMEEESLAEDIENLKMILKNLVHLSFFQERNLELGRKINNRDPSYGKLLANQKAIINRFKIVEDSLYSLSKRQIMVQNIITKDLKNIREYSDRIDHHYNFGDVASAVVQQQYLMQSLNNLALLLVESLENMNNQMNEMQGKGKGKEGKCKSKSPGKSPGSKPSARSMRQLQEQLNKQMESVLKQMQEGKSGSGGQGFSEEFAKMAAQQEAIRRQLQEYNEQLKSMGEGNSKILNELMQQMEQTEKDLVNKRLNPQTLMRQNEIAIRLMESEKAELEREKDDKRTSRTAKVINNSNPETYFQYNRDRSSGEETLRTIPPGLNSFYRQKVNTFFNKLNN